MLFYTHIGEQLERILHVPDKQAGTEALHSGCNGTVDVVVLKAIADNANAHITGTENLFKQLGVPSQ